MSIFVKKSLYSLLYEFELSLLAHNDNGNKYNYKCNSQMVSSVIYGNEDKIFKKIFIKIEDCPKWSREALYELRNNQLLEQAKLEEERKHKEKRKEKILAIKRKIFPFWDK